jgi:hypothetical protein
MKVITIKNRNYFTYHNYLFFRQLKYDSCGKEHISFDEVVKEFGEYSIADKKILNKLLTFKNSFDKVKA